MAMQDITTGENWIKGNNISMYYFLQLHVNLELSQKHHMKNAHEIDFYLVKQYKNY